MSILDKIFGNSAPAPTPAAPTPGNIPANVATTSATTQNAATGPNGVIPATTPASAPSPMSDFADLFKVTPPDPNAPATNGQPLFNVDQNKLLEQARKHSFKEAATPEQMAAIVAGGEGAAQAMFDIMNSMNQQVYAQSAFATTKLIENALGRSGFAKEDTLQEQIRKYSTSATIQEANPLFTNPAVAPLIEQAKNAMLTKYPNATPTELKEHLNKYVSDLAEAFGAPKAAAAKAKETSSESDWDKFL